MDAAEKEEADRSVLQEIKKTEEKLSAYAEKGLFLVILKSS